MLLSITLPAQISITGSNTANNGNTSSLSFNNTIPAGNNMILIVGVTTKEKNITSVTFSGTAMTQLTLVTRAGMNVGLYYTLLGNLASSASGNVVANISTQDNVCIGAIYCSGVNQSTPFANTKTSSAQNSNAIITFTSAIGNLGLAMLGTLNTGVITAGSGQSTLWAVNNNHSNRLTSEPGAASITSNFSLGASADWAMIGTSLQAANVALDIDLKDLYVNCYSNYYQLDWQTLTEKNTDYFLVQRSLNLSDWTDVVHMKAAGNSQALKSYTYQDAFDAFSQVYYRLVEVDLDRSERILMIRSAQCAANAEDEIVIYPNPSQNTFFLNFKLKAAYGLSEIIIQDNLGKMQYRELVEIDQAKFSKMIHHQLVPGFYYLTINSPDGTCLKRLSFIAD